MVAAQIKKMPLAGPTAKKVATPESTPMLIERAVNLSKVGSLSMISPKFHLIVDKSAFTLRRFYEI